MKKTVDVLEIAKRIGKDEEWRASPGETLREVRMGLDLTLREAATALGVTVVELSTWERDKKHVTLDILGWAMRRFTALAMERNRRTRKPLRAIVEAA